MAGSALLAQGIDRRRAILRYLKAYSKRHGFPPSIAEITDHLGLASKTATRHHVDVLIEQGYLSIQQGKYRSLRVIDASRYPR